ncbi:polysaccharide biosynthesis PFTS motif protein [Leptospira noguchii]|uniref:polysaccharide biosynthesis PFTS motif protein n=1 Tax=Leptospira noguchii TaxID=28182 RepID=UPI001FB5A17C|nr:polysaccharide biosynthesis PFTS motif protein [Leptospira noguchii]UOG47548.1 polysaccharide biosynthesis PFTS motif protein [Leptospira noguchii]
MKQDKINKYNFYYYINAEIEKFLQHVSLNYSARLTKSEINRICQIIVNFSYHSLLKISAKIENIQDSLNFCEIDEYIQVDNLKININKGVFKLNLKYRIEIVFYSITYCFYALKNMIKGFLFGYKEKKTKHTIVSDLAIHQYYSNENIKELKNAIDADRFPLLKEADYILLKSKVFHNLKFDNLSFYWNPIFGIFSEIKWNVLDLIYLSFSLFFFLLKELFFIFFSESRFLLLEDRVKQQIVSFLTKFDLIEYFIITNSECISQELYLSNTPNKNFKTALVWYSTNSKLFKYKKKYADPNETSFPWLKLINVDLHFIWNLDQKNWLVDLGSQSELKIFGPILLENPYKKADSNIFNEEYFNIIIFDVTPVSPKFHATFFSHSYIFYSLENTIKIINDTLDWAKNKKAKVYMKNKRETTEIHSREYAEFIEKCIAQRQLHHINYDISIDFILDSKIKFVLCSPFTSVSSFAAYHQKKTAYYDPASVLECNFVLENNQFFLSGKSELHDLLDEQYLEFLKKEF